MNKDNYLNILQKVGLDFEEAGVYYAMLGLGPCTVLSISYETDLQRTLVYRIIKRLMARGLVETKQIGKKVLFTPKRPSTLYDHIRKSKEILHRQETVFNESYPQLLDLYKDSVNHAPVNHYEGFNGCIDLMQSLTQDFEENKKTNLNIIAGKNENEILNHIEQHAIFYYTLRKKYLIKARILAPSMNRAFSIKYSPIAQELDEVACIPSLKTSSGIQIISNTLYAYCNIVDDRFSAFSIYSSEFVLTQSISFDLLWETTGGTNA